MHAFAKSVSNPKYTSIISHSNAKEGVKNEKRKIYTYNIQKHKPLNVDFLANNWAIKLEDGILCVEVSSIRVRMAITR